MKKMVKKTLILLILAGFLTQNTGISYLPNTTIVSIDSLRPLAFKHIYAKNINLRQQWYDLDNNMESFTSVFTISEGYFYSGKKTVGHCRIRINSKYVSINLCSGFKVYDEFLHKGLGSEILEMAFLHAKEQAREKGLNPKWAVVFYEWDDQDIEFAKANPAIYSEKVRMQPAKTMLEKLGFVWMKGNKKEIVRLGTRYRGHWAKEFSNFFESELIAINSLSENDKSILSIGISTMGNAEIEMARRLRSRKIIATTIYKDGIAKVQEKINRSGIAKDQIQIKLEDITNKSMPCNDNTFDFVYARMSLPYLTETQLRHSFNEIYRVLKPGGRFYFAGRSTKDWEYNLPGAYTDSSTGQTIYPSTVHVDGTSTLRRIFFSSDSLMKYVLAANFEVIEPPKIFSERLFCDFERTIPVPEDSSLIDIIVKKPAAKTSSAGNTRLSVIKYPLNSKISNAFIQAA